MGAGRTLISGNPQDMMIGQIAHLNFGGYMLWSLVPVLFALGCSYGIIWMMSHKNIQSTAPAPKDPDQETQPVNWPHTIKGLSLLVIVIGLFFSPLPKEVIALAAAAIHIASTKFRTDDLLGLVDWPVLILFMGLFVVTGSLQSTGYGDQAVQWLAHGGFNLNAPHTLIVVTAILSNLINNSAAVMLLLKVIAPDPHPAPRPISLANWPCFSGSLISSSEAVCRAHHQWSNRRQQLGVNIGFRDFARLSIPVTLAALVGLLL